MKVRIGIQNLVLGVFVVLPGETKGSSRLLRLFLPLIHRFTFHFPFIRQALVPRYLSPATLYLCNVDQSLFDPFPFIISLMFDQLRNNILNSFLAAAHFFETVSSLAYLHV